MPRVSWKHLTIVLVAVLLLARVASELTGRGAPYWHYDLRAFYQEQTTFYRHTYPHVAITPAQPHTNPVRSDYPPSSYWLFLPLMPPGLSLGTAETWFTLLQITSLVAWVLFAVRLARGFPSGLGLLLAGSVLTITGLRADLVFGNFALIATAPLIALLSATEQRRWWLAASVWTFVMVKPQIGWAFAFLLLARGGWRAVIAGVAALSALALAACAWTHVTLWTVLNSGGLQNWSSIVHVSERNSLTTALVTFGVPPTMSIAGCALVGGAIILAGLWRLNGVAADPLRTFAFVAMVNRIFMYHNVCDDLLVALALLWLGRRAWVTDRNPDWVYFATLGLTVWLPTAVFIGLAAKLAALGVWGLVAWRLLFVAAAPSSHVAARPVLATG